MPRHHILDGYYLQGFRYGTLTRGLFVPIITSPIIGMQVSKKGFIYGWSNEGPTKGTISYFILNTKSNKLEWFKSSQIGIEISNHSLPQQDMNAEINLPGLNSGELRFSLITNIN
jgi:hypothetical protein